MVSFERIYLRFWLGFGIWAETHVNGLLVWNPVINTRGTDLDPLATDRQEVFFCRQTSALVTPLPSGNVN